jgi:hypothetical protein
VKVLLTDGAGAYVVRVDEGDVPPGMEMVVVVDDGGGISPVKVTTPDPIKLGSLLNQGDPDDWIPVVGVPPAGILEAAKKATG